MIPIQANSRLFQEYLEAGNSYLQQGEISKAEKQYRLSIRSNPKNFWSHYQLGVTLITQGKWIEAESAFRLSIELDINHAMSHHNLGDTLLNQCRWEDSERAYYNAIKLNPSYFWSHYKLSISLRERGELERSLEALEIALDKYTESLEPNIYPLKFKLPNEINEKVAKIYHKLIDLKIELPTSIHSNIGEYFQSTYQWNQAVAAFKKASYMANLEIGYTQYQSKCWNESNSTFQKVVSSCHEHQFSYEKVAKFSVSRHLLKPTFYKIDHSHKIIYCKIMKNACTLFSRMLVENSNKNKEFASSGLSIHEYLESDRSPFKLTEYDLGKLKEDNFFKFVVLRNPFERLVSGYIDKFVKPKAIFESFAEPVIREVQNHLDLEHNISASITFNQFVHYLARTEDDRLDAHWRPQHTFLDHGLFKFDLIIQFENLTPGLLLLQEKFGFEIKSQVVTNSHITKYGAFDGSQKFHDAAPDILRSFDGYPSGSQLYTPELEAIVRRRFSRDIEIYEQTFGVSIGQYN